MSTYDTNPFPLLDPKEYTFRIEHAQDAIIPGKNGDIPCVEFTFVYEGEKSLQEWKKKIFINQIGGILKACGCKETSKGRFDIEDIGTIAGKYIKCNVEHDILNSGKTIEVLVDVEPYTPPSAPKNEDGKAWDE